MARRGATRPASLDRHRVGCRPHAVRDTLDRGLKVDRNDAASTMSVTCGHHRGHPLLTLENALLLQHFAT